jgi:hypothetical protein
LSCVDVQYLPGGTVEGEEKRKPRRYESGDGNPNPVDGPLFIFGLKKKETGKGKEKTPIQLNKRP